MLTEGKDDICYQRVSLDDVLPGVEQLRCIEAIADPLRHVAAEHCGGLIEKQRL